MGCAWQVQPNTYRIPVIVLSSSPTTSRLPKLSPRVLQPAWQALASRQAKKQCSTGASAGGRAQEEHLTDAACLVRRTLTAFDGCVIGTDCEHVWPNKSRYSAKFPVRLNLWKIVFVDT